MIDKQQTMHQRPVPGQRWVSESEPELGLGVILSVAGQRIELLFAAAGERRLYALGNAPLRRVAFRPGDTIRRSDGPEMVVERVSEENGLLLYHAGGEEIPEAELSDRISFSSPEERLMSGSIDPVELFDLRAEALLMKSRIASSPVRGFVGPRIDLIPHQLSIAEQVASRLAPRVLLADEVGLGKTIEAGLILHHLHRSGRADRVLILVPESLVHQWFVELFRRFNLHVSIMDEERCASIEETDPDANPFLDIQFALCPVELLAQNGTRAAQALEAGWDLLIVDEAHHLHWSPEEAGADYLVVSAFASTTPGLLLLTATPQQLGVESHFARLRLLDPDRYADLDEFRKEAAAYEEVADLIERIANSDRLRPEDVRFIHQQSPLFAEHAEKLAAGDESVRERLVSDLLDSFGTGRVMFRNRRQSIPGFPERKALLSPLDGSSELDTKVAWLAGLLRDLDQEKVLLICRSRQLAEEIEERLQQEMKIDAALFHEDLTLVRRDRNAAWFSEEDGARILISSEIGSEGRNFQFAHHLVLFDLPDDPELLEQRIGRLDRIGQKGTVHIHVPYMLRSRSHVLAEWYHRGLNAFEKSLQGAAEIAESLKDELHQLLATFDPDKLEELIAHSITLRQEVESRLQRGYDRLLQLNSNRPGVSEEIIAKIREADNDRSFETFMLRLFEYFGLTVDEMSERTYLLKPGHLITDVFPPIPNEGLPVTFDRTRGLEAEHLRFLTIDHPFIHDVLDLFLESGRGNATFGLSKGDEDDPLLLDLLLVVETVAPAALDVGRYLPPHPLRLVIGNDLEGNVEPSELSGAPLLDATRLGQLDLLLDYRDEVPTMIDSGLQASENEIAGLIRTAVDAMWGDLQQEIDRLEHLRTINPDVRPEEIERLTERRGEIAAAISGARGRVAGVRLVFAETD